MSEFREQKELKLSWFQLRVEEICKARKKYLYNQIPIQEGKTTVWKKANFLKILSKEI